MLEGEWNAECDDRHGRSPKRAPTFSSVERRWPLRSGNDALEPNASYEARSPCVPAPLERSRRAPGHVTDRHSRWSLAARCCCARWSRILVLAVAVLPARLFAQAGPPYQTDDPDPVEYRHWEFYVATQHVKAGDDVSGTAPQIEVNCGAIPRLQLHILVPLAYARPAGGRTRYGVGDVELGAKLQLVPEGRWRPMVGTFVQTEWPTGSATSGLGAGHPRVLIPLWLQKSFGEWSTDVGGGFWVNRGAGNRDYWVFGWQVQRRISNYATAGTELYRTTADRVGGSGSLLSNAGVVFDITEQHHLLLSVGRSVAGERTVQGYVAYQLTVGPRSESPR